MDVPGLDELIKFGSEGRVSDIAFSSPRTAPTTRDVFSTLPVELRRAIAESLPRKDLANLRIASATFTELRQSYFHHLIKTEMPWVWEIDALPADEVNWHGLWCKLSAADGSSYGDEKKRVWARRYLRTLFDRSAAGDLNREEAPAEVMRLFRILKQRGTWPDTKATELRGLRNRRRIYGDIERILTAIQDERDESGRQ